MAAPSLQVFAVARGAAFVVYNIIDQVRYLDFGPIDNTLAFERLFTG